MPQITLAAVRVNANLSQSALAEILDVDRTTIIHWEKGQTRITTPWLVAFAKACNDFPIDYIFLPNKSTKSGLMN
jgi:DNA-binding XRE family transcriptional regulator